MKRKPRGVFDPAKVMVVGDEHLPSDLHELADELANDADGEVRINFRWGYAQLGMVKEVADLMGISYQQYIKQTLYRQAHADLQQFRANAIAEPAAKYRSKK